jgi:rhodanese-related sulfurtransferase
MSEVKRVSPLQANEKIAEGYTYVDVRTVEEFADGHPAGAVNVPIAHAAPGGMAPNADFIRVMKAAFASNDPIVVGCKAGGRSYRAAQMLLAEGYTRVLDQRAGWSGAAGEPGWAQAGLPSETGAPSGRCWSDMRAKAG